MNKVIYALKAQFKIDHFDLFRLITLFQCNKPSDSDKNNILFCESFDDNGLAERGWYDGSVTTVSEDSFLGAGCIEYEWIEGIQQVQGSSSWRHLFTPIDDVYLRFYIRLSEGFEWSGINWHPHLLHFLKTENSEFHGPAYTHLTLYNESVNEKFSLATQDRQNEDMPHVLTVNSLPSAISKFFISNKYPFMGISK